MVDGALEEHTHCIDPHQFLVLDLLHQFDHESERPPLQGLEQVLAGPVAPVERADADARLFRDLGQGGAGAVAQQRGDGRGEKPFAIGDGVLAQGPTRRARRL